MRDGPSLLSHHVSRFIMFTFTYHVSRIIHHSLTYFEAGE